MTQLNKERLEEIAGMQVKETSNGYKHAPGAYSNVRSVEIVGLARRLLAAEAQEPVGWMTDVEVDELHRGVAEEAYIYRLPDSASTIPLYAAPPVVQPVQVQVPECFIKFHKIIEEKHHGRMPEEVQKAFDECAAMLKDRE